MNVRSVKRHGLKANFIFNFVSQILTLIIPLITTPYVWNVLGRNGNGQYSYSLSIITYFILFANLGFDLYGQKQIAACREDKEKKSAIFWELFVLKLITTAIAMGVLLGVLFGVGFGEKYDKLIFILSIQIVAVPFDIQYFFRGDEDFLSIALRTILMKVAGMVCIFVFVKNDTQVWLYSLCLSLSIIGSNFIMWPSALFRLGRVPLKQLSLLRHLKPTILVFLPTLAVVVFSVFDKTMIGLLAQNPDAENGYYEKAYQINSVALLLVTIISLVMMSRNAYDYSEGHYDKVQEHLYSASRYVWMTGLPLIAGFAVLSHNLCAWFFRTEYEGIPILLIIMSVRFIVSGFGEILGNQLFIAIGKNHYPLIATVCAAVINVTLNYFMIPKYGAVGAAIATAVCEVANTVVLFVIAASKKYISFLKVIASSWKYVISAVIMFVPIFFMQRAMGETVWTFLLITATGAVVYALLLFLLRDAFFLKYAGIGLQAIGKIFKRNKKAEVAPDETADGAQISENPQENKTDSTQTDSLQDTDKLSGEKRES